MARRRRILRSSQSRCRASPHRRRMRTQLHTEPAVQTAHKVMKPPAIHSQPEFLSSSAATAIKAKAPANPPKIAVNIRIRPRGRIRRKSTNISQNPNKAVAAKRQIGTTRGKCQPRFITTSHMSSMSAIFPPACIRLFLGTPAFLMIVIFLSISATAIFQPRRQ